MRRSPRRCTAGRKSTTRGSSGRSPKDGRLTGDTPSEIGWLVGITSGGARRPHSPAELRRRWCYDGEEYSFTGLSQAVLREVAAREDPYIGDAFWYWTHPDFGYRDLSELRDMEVTAEHRGESAEG